MSCMLGSTTNVSHSSSDKESALDTKEENKSVEPDTLDKVWHILYDDCLYALSTCVEGELKHFHKARYKLAQGFYRRGEAGDLERAKEELSFCFKSSRSSFTVNMWEIDGTVRKGRRKNPNVGGSRKNLEVSLSESSRKFITCIRKYMILYLNLLEKNRDLWTLEKAYTYLRTDKRFALCLGDIVPVGLGKYLQVLTAAIHNPEIRQASGDASVEHLLEKMFSVFMDHANLWADISTIPEVNTPELSESNLYSYVHQYIHLLESDVRLDVLEGLNEKIRKRFKTPKLSNSNFAKICKHASLAWCRCILIKLASITPLPESTDAANQPAPLSNRLLLYVDLQPDELLISSPNGPAQFKGLDMNLFETLNRIKNIPIKQTSEDNLETAVTLMKSTCNFYRESSCGTFPSGINLYTVTPSQEPIEGLLQTAAVVETLDLSILRKLLLWVYTLVHGRYSNISSVVKYCDEMKSRSKRGTSAASASLQAVQPVSHSTVSSQVISKEKSAQVESAEAAQGAFGKAALRDSTERIRWGLPNSENGKRSRVGAERITLPFCTAWWERKIPALRAPSSAPILLSLVCPQAAAPLGRRPLSSRHQPAAAPPLPKVVAPPGHRSSSALLRPPAPSRRPLLLHGLLCPARLSPVVRRSGRDGSGLRPRRGGERVPPVGRQGGGEGSGLRPWQAGR